MLLIFLIPIVSIVVNWGINPREPPPHFPVNATVINSFQCHAHFKLILQRSNVFCSNTSGRDFGTSMQPLDFHLHAHEEARLCIVNKPLLQWDQFSYSERQTSCSWPPPWPPCPLLVRSTSFSYSCFYTFYYQIDVITCLQLNAAIVQNTFSLSPVSFRS